jgi:chitodextrinase
VGFLGYRIFNGTVQIATSSSANYVLTGLTANTNYTFSVKTIDAAGNISNGNIS